MNSKNIMIVGVGGQGTLLASRIIGKVLIDQGYDVKLSEVHGMSQRGGSVVTYVKYGENKFSTYREKRSRCYISIRVVEALRWAEYLNQQEPLL